MACEDWIRGPSCEMAMKVVRAIFRARISCSKGRRGEMKGSEGKVGRVTTAVSKRIREKKVKNRHYMMEIVSSRLS